MRLLFQSLGKGTTLRSATGARNQQTARAGEYFVAAELSRRGAYAVTFAGSMPQIDILASNVERTRTVSIQVKTRRSGTWHASTDEGQPCRPDPNETHFWVLVDLGSTAASYYVVPGWWMRNNIFEVHQAYLAKHGGRQKINPEAKHHGIDAGRLAEWKGRWEILKLF